MGQSISPSRREAGSGPPAALVADASAEVRAAVAAVLRTFAGPMEIVEARSGRVALDALLGRQPALAFVNLQLPDLTGAEALAFARAAGVRGLAFLMSGQVLPRWVEIAAELDAYDFLRTPFDPEHVVALLSNWRRMSTPRRVLLVDEAEPSRRHVRGVLANTRFPLDVDESEPGQAALDRLAQGRYALALVACGPDPAAWLDLTAKARVVAPDTRLVLMAAAGGVALGEVARLGIASVLRRPFYAPEFDHHFHTLFGLRRPYLLNALGAAQARVSQAGRHS